MRWFVLVMFCREKAPPLVCRVRECADRGEALNAADSRNRHDNPPLEGRYFAAREDELCLFGLTPEAPP